MLEEGRKEEAEEEKRKSRRKVCSVMASGVDHGNRSSIAKDSLTTADCKLCLQLLRWVALGDVYVCMGKSRVSKCSKMEGVLQSSTEWTRLFQPCAFPHTQEFILDSRGSGRDQHAVHADG